MATIAKIQQVNKHLEPRLRLSRNDLLPPHRKSHENVSEDDVPSFQVIIVTVRLVQCPEKRISQSFFFSMVISIFLKNCEAGIRNYWKFVCLGLALTPVNVYSKYIIIVIININPRRARKLHVIELKVVSSRFYQLILMTLICKHI